MEAILARPAGDGPFAAAILFPHVGGLTDTMELMAGRLAQGGYLCLVPDLYHRLGTIVLDPQSENPDAVAMRKIAAGSLTSGGVSADARAALDWLDASPLAGPGMRGTLGYGKSGAWALMAAGAFPGRIAAAASVLGFGFVTEGPDSPHLKFSAIRGEIYCAFAGNDEIIPAEVAGEMGRRLAALSIPARHVVHAGARHPYAFPDRAVYDKAAAEADWQAIFSMFARRL
jgi:carboxymethylenebutenolidase